MSKERKVEASLRITMLTCAKEALMFLLQLLMVAIMVPK